MSKKANETNEELAKDFFLALANWRISVLKKEEEEERYNSCRNACSRSFDALAEARGTLENSLAANFPGYRVETNPRTWMWPRLEAIEAEILGPCEAPPQRLVQSLHSLGFEKVRYTRESKTTELQYRWETK